MRKRQLCIIYLPLLLWLVLAGITGAVMPDEASRPWPVGDTVQVEGTVYRQELKGGNQSIYLENISVLSKASQNVEAVSEYTKKNVLVYLKEEQFIEIGNAVRVSGICAYPSAPESPGGFDAYSYYGAMDIIMIIKKAVVQKNDHKADFFRQFLSTVRKKASESLFNVFNSENAGILSAMLLGEKNGLDRELKEVYQDNGIIHILAISGLHISILGLALYHLLRKIGLSFAGASGVSGSILAAYVLMTGGSASSVRAWIMFVIFLGAQIAGRTYDSPTALTSAAVMMLLHNPKMVTQAGFLLSFAAVAAVNLSSCFMHPLLKEKALGVSLSIWLVTLPIAAWFYYRIPVYGILLNVAVVPLMPVVLGAGAAGMMAGMCSVKAGIFFAAPAHYVLSGVYFLCSRVRTFPGSTLVLGRPKLIQIVVYYLFLLIFLLFFKKKRKIDLITRAFGIILMISIVLYKEPQKWTMTFLNVGQGDGCCIRTQERMVWMIDGGSSDRQNLAAYSLQPYLEYHEIDEVDYWMISHYDNDHVSGLVEILQSYQRNAAGKNACGITVKHLILPDIRGEEDAEAGESVYEKILELAGQNQIQVLYAGAGDMISQGETCFRILAPQKDHVYKNQNEASMVAEVTYKGFRALLTGDVEGKGEEELLKGGLLKDVDLLKVAHHGSGNSTKEEFIEQTIPEVSMISCGAGNRYGHPHEELLGRLETAGSKIVRTDSDGAVDVIVTEQGYYVAKAG